MSAVVDINRAYRMDTSARADDTTISIPDHTTCAEDGGKRQHSPLIGQNSPLNMYRARSRSPMDLYRAGSRSPTPPPGSDSLSNLHRVTDMLKDKLNNGNDTFNCSSQEMSVVDRKSPYSSGMQGKSVNGCIISPMNRMDNYAMGMAAAAASQHHMSVLLGNEMYGNDSNVLRGILQGKDRMFDSDNKMHPNRRYSDLYRRHQDGDISRNDSIEGESLDSFRSGSPGNMSYDSDPDHRINGISDMDETMESKESHRDNNDSYLNKNLADSSIHSDDEDEGLDHVLDHKKSEVDNLGGIKDGLVTPPERRPKRKQYIPQQHGSQEPSPKRRKIEKEFLQKQLKHMQDQLSVMQQRYCNLFDQGEISDLEGGPDGPEGARMSGNDKTRSKLFGPLSSLDFDPSHFIKQASQLVQEQELLSKNSVSQTSPLRGKTPTDIASLARILKDEITHSVGSLVDTVVAKFVEKHQKVLSSTTLQTPATPVASVDKSLKKERVPSPQVEAPLFKSKSPATVSNYNNNNNNIVKDSIPLSHNKFVNHLHMGSHHREDHHGMPKPPRTKVTDKITHPFFDFHPHKPFADLMRAHPALFPPPPYFPTPIPHIQPLYAKEPEQTEPMALVVGTPTKKKRTKVTDTRLSPRAARALLQESIPHVNPFDAPKHGHHMGHGVEAFSHPPLIPMSLPTSVAIPNPSLQHPDILAMYNSDMNSPFHDMPQRGHSPSLSPNMGHAHMDAMHQQMKNEYQAYEHMMQDNFNHDGKLEMTTTLTPMHLRKAKLMFFYSRYPSSSILKIYFPDVKFNKNNTAQLVKWFSNFREFFYIQMEKYSRQYMAEGVKNPEELMVTADSELYRILNLHYNRNNQIDVPDAFRNVVQSSLREFFRAVQAGKDSEQSWKKSIYKVIARLDDTLPEYFKSVDWMEQLHDA